MNEALGILKGKISYIETGRTDSIMTATKKIEELKLQLKAAEDALAAKIEERDKLARAVKVLEEANESKD